MNGSVSNNSSNAERLEIVRSAERLRAVGPAWTELWNRTDALIFQSHAWISAWWDTAVDRDRRELRIGLIWKGETLIAVVPLAISRWKGLRLLEWAAASYTDYGNILLAPECSQSALTRLWGQISAVGGFDIAFLNRLLPDAAARGLVAPEPPVGIRLRRNHRQEVSHRVAGTWANGAAWFDGLSKKTRKNYRHGRNTLEKSGKLEFRLLPPDEPLGPLLQRLSLLKRKWLEARERQSQLFDAEAVALAAMVDTMRLAGVLHVFVLECDGKMIAVSINFVQHGTMMAWVTTYDPDFGAASPGQILMMDYIRWSLDNGLGMVDFLCGGEAFKERFATQSVVLESVLGIRTLQGSVASLVDRTRQTIRAIRSRRAVPPPTAEADAAN